MTRCRRALPGAWSGDGSPCERLGRRVLRAETIADAGGGAPVVAPEHLVPRPGLSRGHRRRRAARRPGGRRDPGRHRLEVAADAGRDALRRHFLRSQSLGLLTSARKLAGETIAYADEVESCYGVRPRRFSEEDFETPTGDSKRSCQALAPWQSATSLARGPSGTRRAPGGGRASLAEDLRERDADLLRPSRGRACRLRPRMRQALERF